MAIDAFLQFTKTGGPAALEVVGETQDSYFKAPKKEGGPACFELQTWQFGTANTATISSATMGAGSGKATFQPFKITKAIDNATPDLFHTLCVGGHYQLLTLWIRKAGGDPKTAGSWYLQWQFAMAFVQDVTWSHADPSPTEEVSFVYGAIQFTYKQQATTGEVGAKGDKISQWSQVLNANVFGVE
jgi:type VI secretion system secreted protein Hcp